MHEFAQNARSNKFIFYRYMSKQLENGWLTCWLTSWYDNRRKHAIWYKNRHGPPFQLVASDALDFLENGGFAAQVHVTTGGPKPDLRDTEAI